MWYQLRLAKPLTIGVAPLIADLKRLETELGDEHDLVVLAATLRACRELRTMRADIRRIDRLAARMRQPLQRRAFGTRPPGASAKAEGVRPLDSQIRQTASVTRAPNHRREQARDRRGSWNKDPEDGRRASLTSG